MAVVRKIPGRYLERVFKMRPFDYAQGDIFHDDAIVGRPRWCFRMLFTIFIFVTSSAIIRVYCRFNNSLQCLHFSSKADL